MSGQHESTGYSVKEVLDQVSGKIDGLVGQLSAMAITHGVLMVRVDKLEAARTQVSDRSWSAILGLLTGSSGLAAGVTALLMR